MIYSIKHGKEMTTEDPDPVGSFIQDPDPLKQIFFGFGSAEPNILGYGPTVVKEVDPAHP
uniref:Uncharacterized protein n=1 Tax=Romanomermis culicivorax TaxID=13658 RepID=A0A915HF81_ROMCU